MINYIAINNNSILFSKNGEIKRLKGNTLTQVVVKKMISGCKEYTGEEKEVMEFLRKGIPFNQELFLSTPLDLDLVDILPVYYTIFNRSNVFQAIRDAKHKKVLPILLEGGVIYIGPLTNNEHSFNDFVVRLASNDLAIKEKIRLSSEDYQDEIYYNQNFIIKNNDEIKLATVRLVEEDDDNIVWIIEDGKLQRHGFQPFMRRGNKHPNDLMDAVDEKLGIITEVRTESLKSLGVDIYVAVSTTTDYTIYGNSLFAQSNSGAGFDPISASCSAVGESLERLAAGSYSPDDIILARSKEIQEDKVKLNDFVMFSDEQYCDRSFPYKKLDENVRIRWSKAKNLCTGQQEYIPLSFIKLPYRVTESEERITPAISTGLALGKTSKQAILSGFYEVIERDAFALSWFLKLAPNRRLDIKNYIEDNKTMISEKYICNAYDISIQNLLNTVVVTIHDEETKHFMIGAATRFTISEAIKKAFLEAAQGITYINMLVRNYKNDNLIEEFNKIDSFQKHAAFYSIYPEMRKKVGYFLDEDYRFTERCNSNFNEALSEDMTDDDKIDVIVEMIKNINKDVYYVDITTYEIANLGASAARIIVPGMQPLHGTHRYRFLSNKRLMEIGEEKVINNFPHPFP
ncbi:MAG: hypothetical protein GX271_11100 [Clostridiales bacterium]|nr:hypothetical protein [Clostridiales bacterium]